MKMKTYCSSTTVAQSKEKTVQVNIWIFQAKMMDTQQVLKDDSFVLKPLNEI